MDRLERRMGMSMWQPINIIRNNELQNMDAESITWLTAYIICRLDNINALTFVYFCTR